MKIKSFLFSLILLAVPPAYADLYLEMALEQTEFVAMK